MPTFSITAVSISGNKGAESMLTALVQNIKKLFPESNIYLISPYPKNDRQYEDMVPVTVVSGTPIRLLLIVTPLVLLYRIFQRFNLSTWVIEKEPVIKAINASDIVFDAGGITFSDGREIYLLYNVVTILPSILMNKKTIKCAQAMGPFNGYINRFFAKHFLPKIDMIFARGKITASYLKSIGLHNTIPASDLSFSIKKEPIDTSLREKYLSSNGKKIVGIAPSSVVYNYCKKYKIDYIDIMRRFCEWLTMHKGFSVMLIPHSIRIGSKKLKNNDLPIVIEITNAVMHRQWISAIEDDLTASELRSLISYCTYFVASRFHSMISALTVEVPPIVCGWGHKYLEVLEQFEIQEYALDYRNLTLESIQSKFEQLLENEISVRRRIQKNLPYILEMSQKHFDLSIQLMNKNETQHQN